MSLETKRNSYRLVGKDILLPIYLGAYSGVQIHLMSLEGRKKESFEVFFFLLRLRNIDIHSLSDIGIFSLGILVKSVKDSF